MTLNRKIQAGFTLIAFFTLLVAGVGLFGVFRLGFTINEFVENDLRTNNELAGLKPTFLQVRRFEKDFFLSLGTVGKQQEALDKYDETFTKLKTDMENFVKQVDSDGDIDPSARSMAKELSPLIEIYNKAFLEVLVRVENDKSIRAQDAYAMMEKAQDAVNSFEEKLSQIAQSVDKMVQEKLVSSASLTKQTEYLMISLSILALIVSITSALKLNFEMNKVVTNLVQNVEAVKETSSQVSVGNQDLSSRTEEQSASLEETTSTLTAVLALVRQTTQSTEEATRLAEKSVNISEEGVQLSSATQEAMTRITARGEKIAEIVGMVDEISFQTNILAINAAIEAAKAGELGKGFAVVAIEVRDLAQRSADAAKEIKSLIDSTIQEVNQGGKLVTSNSEKLSEVSTAIKDVSNIIKEIASSATEQERSIGEINSAISQLNDTTQQNAALVEEIASSSESAASTADLMFNSINESFTVAVDSEQKEEA